MTRTVALSATLIALAAFAVACSEMMDTSGFDSQRPDEAGDASNAGASPSERDPSASGPLDNAVILVHAAKSQSFRLCFSKELERLPQPDSQAMPEANVVGVDVGGTVRLGPLKGAPGDVYLFDEPLIRAYYPAFGGTGEGPTCGNLLSTSNALSKGAVKLGTIDKKLDVGVHLLVVRGCPGDGPLRQYSVAECGEGWTKENGNLGITEIELSGATGSKSGTLATQVVNLSQPLEGTRAGRDLVISFGDLATPSAKLVAVTSNPALFGGAEPFSPAQLEYATDNPAIYGSTGFRISLVGKGAEAGADAVVLDQTLERVQELSAPRDVPPTYYSTASNYALLLLGDPNAKLDDGGTDTDERRSLHLLAVPVIAPKADAGADGGGEPEDGGAAPFP